MTAPLDRYIKSPPPADERSHFNYLEEQFNKLENVSNKHVVRIGDNDASARALIQQEATARVDGDAAQATYTQTVAAQTLSSATALVQAETAARTTADSALASQITTLQANVGTLSGNITSEASLRLTADEALGTRIDNLVLTSGSSAAVIIDEEASARITADYALGTRIDSLTTTVNSNTAAISTEQTARSTRDDALAKQLFTMSSGSARVYISTTAPSSTGRQAGDVWFDSSTNNYKPFVWAQVGGTGSYDWRDNSDGSYTNKVGNYAVYTQNISTLTNSTNSLTSSVTALQSTVGDSTAGLVKDVSALTTTVGNSSSGLVKDVTTLQSTTAQQRIFRQSTQPSTAIADRKLGDLWFDTSNGNTPYFWNGSAWVANPDNTRATQAALTTEQSVRSSADSAVARYVTTASAGTGRVYTSDPGTTSRQNGDVWLRPEEDFKPYVWYNGGWNDNSSGAYTQYVGQIASVTTTANAAYSSAGNAQNTANQANTTASQAKSVTDNIGYEWRVQGSIDGLPAGSIRLTGAKKYNADATTSTVSKLIIDANAEINGSLLVGSGFVDNTKIADGAITTQKIAANAITSNLINAGTITADKIVASAITVDKINDGAVGTSKIASNAVSNNGYAEGSGGASLSINCRAGARMVIIATHSGGGAYNFNPNGTLFANVNGAQIGAQSMFGTLYAIAVAPGFNNTINWSGGWTVPATTLLCLYTVPSDGTYTFSAGTNLSGTLKILVTELVK